MGALVSPGYARTYVTANGVSVPQLVLSENGVNPVLTNVSEIQNAVTGLGGSTTAINSQAGVDQALAAGRPVILLGYTGNTWRNQFQAYSGLGYYGSGQIHHFIAVLGKTASGAYLVNDPMFTGGTVSMNWSQLSTFFTESQYGTSGLAVRF